MEQLKYNGRIITDGENADINDEISIKDLEVGKIYGFDYNKAIRREAQRISKNEPGSSSYQKEKELEQRYQKSISAMHKIRENIKSHKDLLESRIDLENLIFDLRECGLLEDKSIQKISKSMGVKVATKIDINNQEIEENIDKTKGLPVTTGFIKTFKIDEQTGIKEKYYKSFSLYEGSTEIDVEMLREFCRDTITNSRLMSYAKSKEFIINYLVHVDGMTSEQALEELNKEDKGNELGRGYTNELDNIEVIRTVLKMPIPEELKSEFSQKQLTQYGGSRIESGVDLAKYERKFEEVSKYEKDLKDSKKVLDSIYDLKESEIDSKQKAKLTKRVQKLILKQEKRLNKEKIKLNKIKQSKLLNKYFENIDKYEEVVAAYKRCTMKSFDRYADLNEAFDKNEIEENEMVNVGPVDTEKLEQDKAFIEKMFRADINSVIMKDKKLMALPEPSKQIKSDRESFVEGLHYDTNNRENQKDDIEKTQEQNIVKVNVTEGKEPSDD